jgi:putative transcriptional regulator
MTPTHHPELDDLIAYASGTSPEWLALVVACHLTFCPECRAEVALLDDVGGALLGDLVRTPNHDAAEGSGAPIPVLGPPTPAAEEVRTARHLSPEVGALPRPLHDYFADDPPRFRFLAPGVKHIPLTFSVGGIPGRVVRFAPGFIVPHHAHTGTERVLVLDGELEDAVTGERFVNGDLSQRAEGTHHAQRILDDGCVALVVTDGPIVPSSWWGKVLKALTGV